MTDLPHDDLDTAYKVAINNAYQIFVRNLSDGDHVDDAERYFRRASENATEAYLRAIHIVRGNTH